MAAKSGGTEDCTPAIKWLLAATQCTGEATINVGEFAKNILKSEEAFNLHEEEYETFQIAFAALALDYISRYANNLSKSEIPTVCKACKILLARFVKKLSLQQNQPGDGIPAAVIFTTKQLLLPIRAICTGQSLLAPAEEGILLAILKNAKVPSHMTMTTLTKEKDSPQSGKDSARIRSDLSSRILEHLTVPWQDFTTQGQVVADGTQDTTGNKSLNDAATFAETNTDVKMMFITNNINTLRGMGAGEVLLDMCLNLPHLSRYTRKYQAYLNKKGFSLPANASEAQTLRHSLHSVVSDINTVHNVMSLPLLEPLTPSKLEKLSLISMTCLYCSIANATAFSILGITNAVSPKCNTISSSNAQTNQTGKNAEEEYDALAIAVVEKSLEIFSLVSHVIKNSTRAGGHILQNHLLIGVWLLVAGLQAQLSVSSFSAADKGKEEKGKSPSKARDGSGRINLMKVQQGFGVLSVALASHALSLMSTLLEDASIEAVNDRSVPEPAPLDILSSATALQRAVTFLQAVPLNHLLFYLATISYRKACSLKRVQKHPLEGDALSQSDSTTYYEDLLSCSDNSTDEDEDSEPILGVWFEETLAPADGPPANASKEPSNEAATERTTTAIVPDNREPHGYISLATKIFQFMNHHLISSKCIYVREYVLNGLVEQQMVILAAIIKDLDHETARTETGTIPAFYGATLGTMYSEFSQALSRYTHNMLACNTLSEPLQNTLLQHLGVSPWSTENSAPSTWPLQVLPRTLSVLAQVLLLKPQSEKEAACISIWHRLITTLVESVCNGPTTFEAESEDLNVEHAQLLLFLFHSLNLMQKKSVLLVTGSGAVRCSEAIKTPMKDSQLLHLSRLLLLLEYMMRHLYDAPRALPDQVEWNLFSATSSDWESKDGAKQTVRIFIPWLEIEENYRKFGSQDEFSMKPRFYNLSTTDFNNQDTLKLDGLACSFILGTPDKMKYPLLVDALIDILNVVHQTDMSKKSSDGRDKTTRTGLCAIQSCFSICWRLLLLLPPSTPYMEKLALGEEIPAGPTLLYSLVWGPRAAYKSFTSWMKDCLIKQGMYTLYAENLLKTVSSTVTALKYDVTLAKNCITALQPMRLDNEKIMSKAALPKLGSLCILAAVIGKLQVLLDESISKTQGDNMENSKSPRTPDAGTSNVTTTGNAATTVGTTKTVVEILPHVLSLTEAILLSCRSSVLHQMHECPEMEGKYSMHDYLILDNVICMAGASWAIEASLVSFLPNSVRFVLDKWKSISAPHVPWNTYANDIIPAESYILTTINHHICTLSEYPTFSVNPSLKSLLYSLVTFLAEHVSPLTASENTEVRSQAIDILISLTMDARTEYLQEMANKTLIKLFGEADTESRQMREHLYVLHYTYNLILEYTNESQDSSIRVCIDETIMKRCVKYWEQLLEKPIGCEALSSFFATSAKQNLVAILLCITSPQASQPFGSCVLHFFNALFKAADKSNDGTLARLCLSVVNLAHVDSEKLQTWLKHVILGGANLSPCPSTTNLQTPTAIAANSMVATTGTAEESQQSEEGSNAPNNEQVQWALLLSDGPAARAQPIATNDGEQHSNQESSQLLRALTNYIVRERSVDEDVPVTILRALIPIAYHVLSPAIEANGFSELMHVMSTLADAGSEKGHMLLFKAATEWIEICKEQLVNKEVQTLEKPLPYVDAGCCILNYISDIVGAVCPQFAHCQDRAGSPPWDGGTLINDVNDSDWIDDIPHEDEDSAAEDSDEDSLCNRLCTFTITQKEFMNQHWYHCYSCNMLDGVGVCTVCSRVCHRGHDVTYSKYGNFFCDCGAKQDGSCQALTKRTPQASEQQTTNSLSSIGTGSSLTTGVASTSATVGASSSGSGNGSATTDTATSSSSVGSSSGGVCTTSSTNRDTGTAPVLAAESILPLSSRLRRRSSSPLHTYERHDRNERQRDRQRQATLSKQLESSKDWVHDQLWKSGFVNSLVDLTRALIPAVDASCKKNSAVGCHARAQAALKHLHTLEKRFEYTDQLMLPTLGSQEGAFENVRMNFSGDQGQTIRQLLSAHMIRRVAMCCLSSPHGKRQHLAVSYEKGKITVLQLSALLKQTDSSKRKLTLTRLASAPVPFTVLSLCSNQWNEDFLAVCGFKDCHVLTFNTSGTVSDHLVLHPQLETGNFIIKAIWLPGSQTQLALVTADFVKIFDLAKDALCPQYYFLVPAGKIRDCTFMHTEDGVFHLLIMSSAGYIYGQEMDEESLAEHGPFYVTNTLDVYHPEIKDNGQVGCGGVSIYYSHALQLLFFSYASGKSFIAPLKSMASEISVVFQINLSGNGKANGNKSNNNQPQPLCQWSEVPNHPGLVCSVLQMSNNPVILMIKPDTIMIQEIKVVPAKAKIMDMVAIRHPSSNAEQRTTLILLCEDGSLRIYMAGLEQTGYWMSPVVRPTTGNNNIKPPRKKKSSKAGKPSSSVTFPIDFFEHCQLMNDVEFGGNDLLQIYNVTQIKHRLNTTGLYVVSTKDTGFNVEVTNNDPVLVMTGIRVLLGYQDVQRAPVFVEVFGRTIQTNLVRSRWFDIPLTRDESLQADKKLTITFGPSKDLEGVIMVDCIKIYGKTKDAFGWPEEVEDISTGQPTTAPVTASSNEAENAIVPSTPLSSVDSAGKETSINVERLVSSILEVVELSFNLASNEETKLPLRATAIDVASRLLILPAPPSVQMHTTSLLAALHPSKQAYHFHKDQVLLLHVLESLKAMRATEDPRDIDAENFYRLVLIVRGISVARPLNLAKFTEQYGCKPANEVSVAVFAMERAAVVQPGTNANSKQHPVIQLMEILWLLHLAYPKKMALAPVVVPGLTHAEATVHALVEIIHAFTSSDVESNVPVAAKLYLQLLLSRDTSISFSAKQAIIRVLRPRYKRKKVYIPSPPTCETPDTRSVLQRNSTHESDGNKLAPGSVVQTVERESVPQPDSSAVETGSAQIALGLLRNDNNQQSRASSSSANPTATVPATAAAAAAATAAVAATAATSGTGSRAVNPLEALLTLGALPQILDYIPPDTDDEAVMELAIALSLQEHAGESAASPDLNALRQGFQQQALPNIQGLPNLHNLLGVSASQTLRELAAQVLVQGQEAGGHYSDTTASAGGSDDEALSVTTDATTLRNSSTARIGNGGSKGSDSGGSESGGSAIESIPGEHSASGRSSAYGDSAPEIATPVGIGINQLAHSESSNPAGGISAPFTGMSAEQESAGAGAEQESETNGETMAKLHNVRLLLLDQLTQFVPNLQYVPGVLSIPFMQVILMLTSDLDGQEDRDKACIERLLQVLVDELEIDKPDTTNICQRSYKRECHLVIMRLLSVLMCRSKYTPKAQAESPNFVSRTTATILTKAGVIDYCLALLKALLEYWKTTSTEDTGIVTGGQLLKEHLATTPPDMSPFFLCQYVKGHAADVFEPYPQLLTELILRLPYQVHKYADKNAVQPSFEQPWYFYLCEYMMSYQTPVVRRQVRKLLLFICGNKEKYRQLRDVHALISHIQSVQQCCAAGGYDHLQTKPHTITLPYDSLVELIEHLKCCVEIATSRTGNWQRFCLKQNTVLANLFSISTLLDEGVSPTVLQLLQCAICSNNKSRDGKDGGKSKESSKASVASGGKERRERERSEDSDTEAKFEEAQCLTLVEQIQKQVPPSLLTKFIQTFLLETNNTNVRWQAHSLILAIYKNYGPNDQEALLDLLWRLWPLLPACGRKAAQFVDLLGYFSLKTPQVNRKMHSYMEQAVSVLHAQNQLLARHPNASLYANLAQFVELDGYYLESEPCLVCNNPEVPMSTIKLSSIKVDSKFTTTTQIVKLVGSHTISRITLRIGDLKRTKMVRTINIYYNNRSVQAVVELKNKPAMWHKAKKISLAQGQSEIKMEFPLPIVACNLMIEYADFYENIQASSETLPCPRCSANVPANPGVCSNCGENAFQCHKCRAINYDEKDPFLCHACGFCKYAKFDYTLTGRPCCAVDSIENDDDRKKTIATINSLLEKADKVYKTLISNKPTLETLLVKISEHRLDRALDEGIQVPGNTQVNRAIQMLAQRYCGECKNSFEELSKIIQRVLACRRELIAYDRQQRNQSGATGGTPIVTTNVTMSSASPGTTCATSVAAGLDHLRLPTANTTSTTNDDPPAMKEEEPISPRVLPSAGRCYGCATAATEHCLTLLRALATNPMAKDVLCKQGLIQELVEHNLRKGTIQMQEEVRQLLCLVTRDNPHSTKELCSLLTGRITLTLRGRVAASDLSSAVRHEMALLAALLQKEDSCWEQKLRCVMQLFLTACRESKSPVVMESIILPCLKILQGLVKPEQPTSKKNKDKNIESLATINLPESITVDVNRWLSGDLKSSYSEWNRRAPPRRSESSTGKTLKKEEARALYLMEKYGHRWQLRCTRQQSVQSLKLTDGAWLKEILFNPSSQHAREVACNMIESLCQGTERKKEVLVLLTRYLEELRTAGESSTEFLTLYQSLIRQPPWKQFLAVRGVMPLLADLLTREIEELHRLEETTLTSDLAQGYSLRKLTELLGTFLLQKNIKQQYKGRLVGAVLNGYLSLRRLVVQRTILIDDTQEHLLELLEEMTTGTEDETKAFMAICVETVQKYSLEDVRTPVFIFERLCSIIYPEENDVGEFFLTLEKDPQQEDFLQGRMLGNPYSSLEPGLGPLMRDVKNKICQDCELVALLEDDNGMELLVSNKIISLDLPVKEVYKKIWLPEGGECGVMRVIYRMRGLLGDATEEFVESLNANSEQEVNNEEVYKMANVLADCGGLQVMLTRLAAIQDVNRARPLLQVLLKLFWLSVKVKLNQEVLSRPELGAVTVLLDVLQRCLVSESDNSHAKITEQLLDIMETILANAASQSLASFEAFSRTLGGPEHVKALLSCTQNTAVRQSSSVLAHLARVLAALTYGNTEKMDLLFQYFQPVLNFYKFDFERTSEDEQKLELFCILTQGIERNAIGNTLKDYIISMGVVMDAVEYITVHAPCVKPTLRRTDSDELKDFISKPALKYILRFLTGLARDHEPTQLAVSKTTISIIHRLEQVSSDEHVGSLAENLLEALCTNKRVAELIEEARQHTRSEKKRLAMAMRERQLGALGMQTNDKGQVTASGTILQQMEDLGEETGLVCVICREGYKFKPNMVLGIYTFTKRCNVEEFETKQRKTVGYTTVTHFNVVHVDCHMSAVRLARARDEWESAALQNANTKCNGLLPLWGPQVPESAFASCLARHNTYLQECTGHRDISYASTVQDLKLLLLRFAQGKSFHEDTGGGGPQSNMHLIPYLIHMALYVINTTRSAAREEKTLLSYLESTPSAAWLESCYEAEGPLYLCTMSLLLLTPARWKQYRIAHLNRLIILAHQRYVSPSAPTKAIVDCTIKNYQVYESVLVFFGLLNCIYDTFFKKVNVSSDDQWPAVLAKYIRHNDEAMLKASERVLKIYRDELLPCSSFGEFCDANELLGEITDPYTYISSVLRSIS